MEVGVFTFVDVSPTPDSDRGAQRLPERGKDIELEYFPQKWTRFCGQKMLEVFELERAAL
jgi:hypothetical protein